MGPGDKIIMDTQKERQGDFVFTAKETGEYRFCFDNDMSTFAEKMVDFEIAVWLPFPFTLSLHPCGFLLLPIPMSLYFSIMQITMSLIPCCAAGRK